MKDRKSIPKTALPRIYFIDREIASGKYPNTRTLAKAYETGTATISRDIEFMRDMMNAPIEYDFTKKGYYYTEKTFRLPAAFGSAEDMLALGMAKTLLTLYKNTPIYNAAKELMESITAPLGKADNPRWHEDRIVVPPIPAVQFPPEVWNKVCEGVQKNHALSFDYRPDWQSGYTRRLVYPYQLLFDNGAWYIYAYLKKAQADRRSAGMRMYSLSRIKNISVEKEKFTFPASAEPQPSLKGEGSPLDFRVRTDGSYLGAYSTEKKQKFRIAFYNDAAMRVKERLWAADQKIKETKDGVILSFSSSQYGKVLELVLSNGRDALPLEPAELVKDWKENLKGMRERAGDSLL